MAANKSNIYIIPEGSPVAPDKFDVRVRNRHLSSGTLSFDELKKYLSSLPDDSERAELRNYDTIVNDDSVESGDSPVGAPEGGTTTH